jgi:hypothetical protein
MRKVGAEPIRATIFLNALRAFEAALNQRG